MAYLGFHVAIIKIGDLVRNPIVDCCNAKLLIKSKVE